MLNVFSRDCAAMALRGPHPFTHVVSIAGWMEMEPVDGFGSVPNGLFLAFDDVTHDPEKSKQMGYIPPDDAIVQKIIDFARTIPEDAHVMTHCAAGISRSTAAAFIIQAIQRGPGLETLALDDVVQVRNSAQPNRLMVEIADRLLGREGKMVAALEVLEIARRTPYASSY